MAIPNKSQNNSTLPQQDEDLSQIIAEACKKAERLGYMKGYRDGYSDGAEDAIEQYKPLMSDALRAGLSSGGKAMQGLKK